MKKKKKKKERWLAFLLPGVVEEKVYYRYVERIARDRAL